MAGIQTIRNNLTGTASKVIVGIIAVTFALFFGGNYVLFDNDANVIASVNSKKIDVFDLDLEMARVQSILRQRFDDPDFSIEEEALFIINIIIRNYNKLMINSFNFPFFFRFSILFFCCLNIS